MQTQQYQTTLPPELSALEASLASLEPLTLSGSRETVKANVLMRMFDTAPPLSGEKLIETIVKTGDQEITLSLREYVKSARLVAGLYGAAVGIFVGVLLGVGLMLLIVNQPVQPVREVYHVPYFVSDVMNDRK
jgi:hypothetical protein